MGGNRRCGIKGDVRKNEVRGGELFIIAGVVE